MRIFRIDRKEEAIAEVQRYLRAVSYAHPSVPHVGIDGIFGTETAEAIRAFQRIFSLLETGSADPVTFALLYREYLLAKG